MTDWRCSKLSCISPGGRRVRCLLCRGDAEQTCEESGFSIQILVGNLPMKGTYEKTPSSLAH